MSDERPHDPDESAEARLKRLPEEALPVPVPGDAWQRLKHYFAHGSDLPLPAREALLSRVARDDPEVVDELEKLLATEGGEDMEAAIGSMARELASADESDPDPALEQSNPARWVGEVFGPYRVVAPIARGGMGEVLRAERIDGEYEQQVALKVLSVSVLDPDGSRRFREERQILARLNHPGIARILDGGTTPQGLSYLVMELIEGEPIDRYCRANQLTVKEVLRLFRHVCAAVEYAHSNLIVHRDIKPGNILVDATGQPKLLDFGIAKLLEPSAADDAQETLASERRMTREYASPEQLLGLPITTASDIYSLGVLLYELLTQCRPRALSGMRPTEMEELIFNTEPTRPSDAVEERFRDRAKALKGDIDNIVLMALSAEPGERYGSAQQLSADIRRWLGREPVAARPRNLGYVAAKFLQRNSWWVTAALGVAAVLMGSVSYHVQRINAERERVEVEAQRTGRVAKFLGELLHSTSPDRVGASEVTARTLLDSAREDLNNALTDEPQVRASLLGTIGSAYSSLGLSEDAVAALEEAVALTRNGSDRALLAAQLMSLGQALEETVALDGALAALEESLAIAREPGVPVEQEANALRALAHVQHLRGEYAPSIQNHKDALERYAALDMQVSRSYAKALTGLGQSLMFADQGEESVVVLEQALKVLREAAPDDRYELLKYQHNLATALIEVGEDAQAEPILREVVHLEGDLLGKDNPERDAAMVVLGLLYQRLGRLDEAQTLMEEALDVSLRLRGEQHRYTAYDRVLYARLLAKRERFEAAEAQFVAALAVYQAELESDHPYLASAHVGYGTMLLDSGRAQEAEEQARSAIRVCAHALPPQHWLAASSEGLLGIALARQGRSESAREHLQNALAVLENMPGRLEDARRVRNALDGLPRR